MTHGGFAFRTADTGWREAPGPRGTGIPHIDGSQVWQPAAGTGRELRLAGPPL
ncbi:hypothetical protein JBE04_39775 [Streptomyces sp. PRKS01-29]|uniref:hypothetical protein n=1 Tax=Streptomyces sp. MK37H TaxID=2699117 RepID=UPI0018DDA17D|nr:MULTISPECIES: hypothetical protein [Streptomyces]MBI0300437.1 hypothetical protein [Streptomyces sabulosicollis]MBP8539959.1 hypothetical protein [Streptomyces sp. MK37H]